MDENIHELVTPTNVFSMVDTYNDSDSAEHSGFSVDADLYILVND